MVVAAAIVIPNAEEYRVNGLEKFGAEGTFAIWHLLQIFMVEASHY